MSAALSFEGVTKEYARWTEGGGTLRGMLSRRVPTLVRGRERRTVLRDVTFAVDAGEMVGVIGANGAGKSTLLRLAAGLGVPTAGTIGRRGSVRAVLSLGETFDPTLSGAENAVTAAMIAGLPEAEARRALPAILDYAELAAFAEAPLRTYSDGMQLRLAMAVVARLPGDVLVLDEVIAVGDLRFQERCMEHARGLRAEGRAVLFASHDLDRVAAECDRAVWLEGGSVRAVGGAEDVVAAYRGRMLSATVARTPQAAGAQDGVEGLELGRTRHGSQQVAIGDVRLLGDDGGEATDLPVGAPLSVAFRVAPADPAVRECIATVSVHRRGDGVKCLDANTEAAAVRVSVAEGATAVAARFERVPLAPGDYDVEVGVYATDWSLAYDMHHGVYPFRIVGPEPGGRPLVPVDVSWRVAGG